MMFVCLCMLCTCIGVCMHTVLYVSMFVIIVNKLNFCFVLKTFIHSSSILKQMMKAE